MVPSTYGVRKVDKRKEDMRWIIVYYCVRTEVKYRHIFSKDKLGEVTASIKSVVP